VSHYDIVIKGGTVFDGLQTPRFKADIAIKDGRIARIGSVDAADASEVVDATGKHVAPRVCRPAHALRQSAILGPLVHHVGLARGHQRRHW
jgi:adenine deaminase